jgi:hypothetical protein
MAMARFTPKNPDFRRAATAVFDAQPAMRTLGTLMALMTREDRTAIETPQTEMV